LAQELFLCSRACRPRGWPARRWTYRGMADRGAAAHQLPAVAAGAALGAAVGFALSWAWHRPAAARRGGKRRAKPVPKRLILVRHGESEGNVDHSVYRHKPDNALHLTARGRQQALAAGRRIKEEVGGESTKFIVSPYVRTRETFAGIAQAFGSGGIEGLEWREDPRVREQDFGNFQDPEAMREAKDERRGFGEFYYRFEEGESSADVYDRVSSFLESLYRMWYRDDIDNYILVLHGLTINVFLMRFFKYSVDEFNQYQNFENGEFVVLERNAQGDLEVAKVVQGSEDGSTATVFPSQRRKPRHLWAQREMWDGGD